MTTFTAVILAAFLGLVNIAEIPACTCDVKHPQTQYKEADFVVKAKVMGKFQDSEGPEASFRLFSYLEYEVRLAKIFKGQSLFNGDVVSMYTPEDSSCGIKSMRPGKSYLISGHQDDGSFYLNVCSWVEKWSNLTKEQKNGLKPTNVNRCKECDVPAVSGPELFMTLIDPGHPDSLRAPPPKLYSLSGLWTSSEGHCTYNPVDSQHYPTSDCETLYTYCMLDGDQQCAWQLNRKYKECFIDRETSWAKREVRRSTLRGRTGIMRLGSNMVQCSLQAPEEEFHGCMRREVARIVTQYL